MNLAALKPEQYLLMQSTMRSWIIPTLCHSDLELEEIENSILDGQRLPIVFIEEDAVIGAMVLELNEDVVHITTLAGDMPSGWHKEILKAMTSIARSQKKKRLQCTGRKGWQRVLKKYGAKMHNEYLQIEVN